MWSKKDTIVFLAGASAFHTLSHVMLKFAHVLPLNFFGIALTNSFNGYMILINTVITLALLWWALRIK